MQKHPLAIGLVSGVVGTILVAVWLTVVSNGLKMTGMPAFGQHHSSEEIVALTAFVSALPGLAADDYASLIGSAPRPAEQTPQNNSHNQEYETCPTSASA